MPTKSKKSNFRPLNWHSLEEEKIFDVLKTSKNGLSENEAFLRLKRYGLNKLPEEKPISKFSLFLKQFKSPLVFILVIAGVITLFLKDFSDSIIIWLIIVFNAFIGFFQENKTNQILMALKKSVTKRAHIIRDGNEKEVESQYLVPGDIIVLEPGYYVPADGRLISSSFLKVNEASLTGEWWPIKKTTNLVLPETALFERENMVYMGTLVEEGRGLAVVVATGAETEIGKIAKTAKEIKEAQTPFQRKVSYFSKILGGIIILLSLVIFILGIIGGKGYLEMFTTVVAVAVAAIPEGLPLAVTVVFAFGMQQILKNKGLVKNMLAAEILGSTSVICTDKTGTLTEAKMQVAGIFTGTKELLFDGENYFKKLNQNGLKSHITVLKIALLSSDAYIENPEDEIHRWIIRGRPLERALLLAGIQAGLSKKELEKQQPKIDSLTFDSVYKYSASVHSLNDKEDIIYIMGAPEAILEFSAFIEFDGKQEVLNKDKLKLLKKRIEELTSKALRLVAVGYKKIPKESLIKEIKNNFQIKKKKKIDFYKENLEKLVFVGFIALKDPIRKEAKSVIKICKEAGMRPIIVTGDHKLTALAIAKELDFNVDEKNILEGKDLEKMSKDDFQKIFKKISIYTRLEPSLKLKIIEAWQKDGAIVAMVGDGINDAPALKRADIGVALGSGTEVAKEASDLVLLSDKFSIIVAAVAEGRRIIDNIRKIITYFLIGGFTEIMIIGLSVIFGLPLPVLPGQILWKNFIESALPSLALAFEPKEKDIMNRPPEDPNIPLLNLEMKILIFIIGIITNLFLFGMFLWFYFGGYPLEKIRSIIFVGLAIDSFFFIFSCRNLRKNIWQYNPFSNLYLNTTILIDFFFLIIALYIPLFQKLLKTVSLGIFEWIILVVYGVLNLIAVEIGKWIYLNKIKDKIK